jgi:peptide/nickel transport system substrate-binding protein
VLRQVAISCLVALLALPAAARTRPHYGGTLRMEIEGDPWQQPNGLARRMVLDGLTRMDADGSAQPALAVEWKSENEDHRWQFRLRPGVRFHDGSFVTSDVVVTALSAACAERCPWTSDSCRWLVGGFHRRRADAQPARAAGRR